MNIHVGDVSHIIQLAIAPVFLLSGIGPHHSRVFCAGDAFIDRQLFLPAARDIHRDQVTLDELCF